MSDQPLLVVQKGGRRVNGGWIWRGLAFELQAGDRAAVVGPSGSGKTLLLRALAGLDRLDEGRITLRGREINTWKMTAYRSNVMYLSQTPALMEGTVEDNLRVVFGFEIHSGKAYDQKRILHYLGQLGRGVDFLQRSVQVLSGGERQIATFLRVLQLAPDVLLLDEPTASLDAEATQHVEQLVAAWLAEDPERAVLWTSHRADQIERMTTAQIDLTVSMRDE